MDGVAFLNRVDGNRGQVLLIKMEKGLLKLSPQSNALKRAYHVFVYNPIKCVGTILQAVILPIELIASAAIYLVAAAFVKDKKAELMAATMMFVGASVAVLSTIVVAPLSLFELATNSFIALRDPQKFEKAEFNRLYPELQSVVIAN